MRDPEHSTQGQRTPLSASPQQPLARDGEPARSLGRWPRAAIVCGAAALTAFASPLVGIASSAPATREGARPTNTSGRQAPGHTTTRVNICMPQLDLEGYVARADAIAHVTVEERRVELSTTGMVHTIYQVHPISTWLGELPNRFEVIEPGGETELRSVVVPEARELDVGREYLLFFTEPIAGTLRGVVGLGRGTYSIDTSVVGVSRVAGLHAESIDLLDFQQAVNERIARTK